MGKSETRTKQRDHRRVLEGVMQAHDRLHKDDVEGAHEMLHHALGTEDADVTGEPLSQHAGWDKAFLSLCGRFDVRAAFILVDTVDEESGYSRLLMGGDSELCTALNDGMKNAGAVDSMPVPKPGTVTESGLYLA